LEDFLGEAVAIVARELMEAEISAEIGAKLGEIAPESRSTHRNGYRYRSQLSISARTCPADNARGRPASRHPATDGTTPANGFRGSSDSGFFFSWVEGMTRLFGHAYAVPWTLPRYTFKSSAAARWARLLLGFGV
jgi:hypothetical protein